MHFAPGRVSGYGQVVELGLIVACGAGSAVFMDLLAAICLESSGLSIAPYVAFCCALAESFSSACRVVSLTHELA